VAEVTLDGVSVDAAAVPLVNDGRTHQVHLLLGDVPRPATAELKAEPRIEGTARAIPETR
jgi:hypothetical protein